MITADPEKKALIQAQVLDLLSHRVPDEDRELALAYGSVAYAETPDRIALVLPPEALAERILKQFLFVARTIPPSFQLYKGLPGIHVSARNPSEAEAAATGSGFGLPLESTIVETHTPDAPFIFDSLKNYFSKAGLRVYAAVHPIFTVRRQWERIVAIGGPHEEGSKEVYCQFQIERVESREQLRHIEHQIFSLLKCLFLAVEDFHDMEESLRAFTRRVRSRAGADQETASIREFLSWLASGNYIFLGMAPYSCGTNGVPERRHDSVAGVFRDATLLPVVFPGLVEEVEERIMPGPGDDQTVFLDYCRKGSAIYHLEPIDAFVLREWNENGALAGATLLLGRFGRGAVSQRADTVPILKDKLAWLLRESGAVPMSHTFREIRATFNHLPMRVLFYASPADLKQIIEPIVFMMGDDEVHIYCRKGTGYDALSIAFSRLRYSYRAEETLRRALASEFGPISFHSTSDLGATTLLIFYFDRSLLEHPIEIGEVRRIVLPVITTWEDRVSAALEAAFGEREGRRLFRRHVRPETRSGLYREITPPELVPDDLRHMEALETRLEVHVAPLTAHTARLHLYSIRQLGLTGTLRTFRQIGLAVTDELRVPLILPDGRQCFLYRFEVEAPPERITALLEGEERFVDAMRALDEERATDDRMNELILTSGLTWREVEILRTVRNHLLQLRTHYNVETLNDVLLVNNRAGAALYRYFRARFDPALDGDRGAAIEEAQKNFEKTLESVRNLAEDEVLRAMFNLASCALRTNFYQRPERPVFSIKVDSRRVEGMPSPRPLFEIYVHSRLLEGIHLRGGKVARGGIRWSDRHDDFRTEILGLMKTQMVKNSIIVPVGSKGGFVLKGQVPARPSQDAYVVDRYREFISGLLDVTDNIVDGKILHPPEVVRHDADDPYLVVAADKGTAHLSDTANSVSSQYGFWLGDAFASGGSHGYDHKKVGITARGAWECVKHHFRNLGIDVQKDPISVCGIGDMSGDVFGNGVLLSRSIRLVAAFNHAHIFIDPDPDPEKGFAERERLFQSPRSSWSDYNPALISQGGGVYQRSAKSIPVTPEMRKWFDVQGEHASGEEIIRQILTAKVDLLYNGGIGTYVKASSEEHAGVGDRTNDRFRVDACNVRARVVAEGGNLGFTQRARIEYWLGGGLINTDAVDNSGGVDMSDHEVNIKILLNMLVKQKVIRGKEERNQILAEMTEEVAALVLADNAGQARALTLDEMRSAGRYEAFVGLIDRMVKAGQLNRADEGIPSRTELLDMARPGRGMARPLLAVLMGYSKMHGFNALLQSDFPESAAARPFLDGYFPRRLRDHYAACFQDHVLRREIIATQAINYVVNHGGVSLLPRFMGAANAPMGQVVEAYITADRESDAPVLRQRILEAGFPASEEHALLLDVEEALETGVADLLAGKSTDLKTLLAAVAGRVGG
ncbi:MAG: NAD-glutamate dehydrogenase [Acidobacteria bacterium]|nr:NAD-glutamate dehydrogenase [Acidobacteriota bacterium]